LVVLYIFRVSFKLQADCLRLQANYESLICASTRYSCVAESLISNRQSNTILFCPLKALIKTLIHTRWGSNKLTPQGGLHLPPLRCQFHTLLALKGKVKLAF